MLIVWLLIGFGLLGLTVKVYIQRPTQGFNSFLRYVLLVICPLLMVTPYWEPSLKETTHLNGLMLLAFYLTRYIGLFYAFVVMLTVNMKGNEDTSGIRQPYFPPNIAHINNPPPDYVGEIEEH